MAITRAQQAKQMLQDGGRTGFFRGGKGPGETKREQQATSQYGGPPQDVRRGGGKDSISVSDSFRDDSSPQVDRDNLREQYAADKSVKTGQFKPRFPGDTPGRRGKDAVAEFYRRNPAATLNLLKRQGVPEVPFGIPFSSVFNAFRPFRNFTLGKNIDYFSDLKNRAIGTKRGINRYERSAEGYKQYMKDRLAGKIDAAGNIAPGFMEGPGGEIIPTGNDGRDDTIIPVMAKAMEEEDTKDDLSNIFSRFGINPRIAGSIFGDEDDTEFAADGGRIGYQRGGRRGDTGQASSSQSRSATSARDRAMGSGGKQRGGTNTSSVGGGGGGGGSPQQTITRPSGGIPAANIFDEAARRAGFQLIDPKQRRRFAEVFDRKKIIESGAGVPKSGFGLLGGLTDEGQALEDFRKSAVNFKKSEQNTANTPQAALNFMTDRPGLFGDIIENKDFIQKAIDEGFLGKESDYEDQQPLGDYLAEGGMVNQNLPVLAAEGGIMDLGRQELFLGGIAKGLKKAARGVSRTLKKVAKSPIGKAALLYAATGGLGNLAAGKGFGSMFTNFTSPAKFLGGASKIFTKGGLQNIASRIGLGSFENIGGERIFKGINPLLAIGGVSALSGLLTKKGDDDDEDEFLRQYYDMRLDPSLSVRGTGSEFDFYGGERMRVADGGDVEPVAKKTMPLLDMDGQEMDLRAEGGFVPIGRMEKADDVPARLSKNEFVFTADAVRNAGDGDVDKGAEVMYNMMKNLERGGNVSDESQGLEGAREMFQTSKRLEEVL